MNRLINLAAIMSVLCGLGCTGKNTVIKFNLAEVLGVRVHNGDVEDLPRATLVGLEAAVPLPECWAWHGEPGFATGHAAFLPSPRLFTGPSVCLSDRWRLGGGLVYQLNPGYHGYPSHILGGGLGPSVAVNEHLILGWPVGLSRDIRGGPIALTTQIRLMLVLHR